MKVQYSSRVHSGYPWIGEVPEHWHLSRIGQLFQQRSSKVSDRDYPALSVTKSGIVPQMEHVAKTDDNDNRKLVKAGDFVINSRSDRKGSSGIAEMDGSVSLINTVLQINEELAPRYCHHLLRSTAFQEEFYRMGSGLVADLWSTNFSSMKNIRIPHPPLGEQTAIASFLDRETARIDGLIKKKVRFIELLKEKCAALITHAVTKGIDGDVPMKDSGVEWIGQVPSHWDVSRIAALFREAFRAPDPSLPVLSVSIHDGVTDGELSDEERDRKVSLSEDRTKYQGVAPGDLVYNMMRAWQGAFGAVQVDGLVSPAYVVAHPIAEFRTKFIEHILHTKSASEEIRRFSRGIADFRMRLYWDHFRNLRVCLPSLEEQDEILAHIDRETTRIDGLISTTNRSIELLKEKRSALITAAVTGKIDVRNAA
ncbi:restriction endonuclease subunit S [Sulfitobacter sp. R18_1]|uniref:restriction endonuclease subunit S n=1 Tax=Sulfitobacter sp. R18_1 TaxID=2821104 RepID=UPI001AD9DC03|nr:restriction endonuclease subunit S [Sulfitobacter sp. R18_1]MBO9431647.1 restriction endonuclease subunit S [Sulfitobacter sp. R18_1]